MFGKVTDPKTKERVDNEDIVQLTGRITEVRNMRGVNMRFLRPEQRSAQ